MNKKAMLLILDGFGLREEKKNNAVKLANMPNLNQLFEKYGMVKGRASGLDVGLPEGQMGNSEVGHLNIGAGRIIYQSITRISKAIEDKSFFENKEIVNTIKKCKKNNNSLHLLGLLSDGGVHSLNTHLYALLKLAKKFKLRKVYVHAFLDGRDTPPNSAEKYLKELQSKIDEIGIGEIATIMGRFYGMDRDNIYSRTEKAYNCLVNEEGEKFKDYEYALKSFYEEEIYDEFIRPSITRYNSRIKEDDGIIFFNFRPDRARQITRAFVDKEFDKFEREYINTDFVCFTDYDTEIKNKKVAFKPPSHYENTLGEYIAKQNLKQLRTAETQKYAHVTFFFNGGEEKPNKNEERILIDSPKIEKFDKLPEMSVNKVTDVLIDKLEENEKDLYICNFANPDMLGHTGNLEATIKGLEIVDENIGRIYEKIKEKDIALFICADHGNCELMYDEKNDLPHTAHTTNFVPFSLINYGKDLKENGKLCDIAPTIFEIMGLEKPKEMTGESLIKKEV